MPYNFAAESFHTKKLVADFIREKPNCLYGEWKISFLRPLWWLGATYAVRLRLIGKHVGDFLLVIIEPFSLGAFVLSQCTRLTDRRTNEQTDRRLYDRQYHACIQWSAVKKTAFSDQRQTYLSCVQHAVLRCKPIDCRRCGVGRSR